MEPKTEIQLSERPSPPGSAGDTQPPGSNGVVPPTGIATTTSKDYKAEMLNLVEQLEKVKREQEQADVAPIEGTKTSVSRPVDIVLVWCL